MVLRRLELFIILKICIVYHTSREGGTFGGVGIPLVPPPRHFRPLLRSTQESFAFFGRFISSFFDVAMLCSQMN